jgi:hypothetical protein
MADPPCEIDVASIVFVGKMNPAIFQPSWFGARGLVKMHEAETANVRAITDDYSSFEIALVRDREVVQERLTVEVTRERCVLNADIANGLVLRDVATQLFRILEHSPISAVGLNRAMHFRLPSEDARDALGYLLAPPATWPAQCRDARMRSLTMLFATEVGGARDSSVRVEPSRSIEPDGVYLAVNFHNTVSPGQDGAGWAATIVEEGWEAAMERAKAIALELVRKVAVDG